MPTHRKNKLELILKNFIVMRNDILKRFQQNAIGISQLKSINGGKSHHDSEDVAPCGSQCSSNHDCDDNQLCASCASGPGKGCS